MSETETSEGAAPEVWGDGCECWVTPEHMWLSAASCGYGSGYEPGSQIEFNPDCPKHGYDTATSPTSAGSEREGAAS